MRVKAVLEYTTHTKRHNEVLYSALHWGLLANHYHVPSAAYYSRLLSARPPATVYITRERGIKKHVSRLRQCGTRNTATVR